MESNQTIKQCVVCSKEYKISTRVSIKDRHKRKACSTKCGNILKTKIVTKICEFCKKTFVARKPNGMSYPEKRFCNNTCASYSQMRNNHPLKGKHLSEAHRKKISDANKGEKANNWMGGVWLSQPQHERKSIAYKRLRREILERDDFTCQLCGVRGGELNVDHIKSYSKHPDLRLVQTNLRTLCVQCHKKTPTYAKG